MYISIYIYIYTHIHIHIHKHDNHNNDNNEQQILIMIIIQISKQAGVSTNGVTAISLFFRRGDFCFGIPVDLLLSPPIVPGRTFFPNPSNSITFAAAPLVLIPFVRNQSFTCAPTSASQTLQSVTLALGIPFFSS